MISRFFIDRPIFASVLSIVIVLAGGICAFTLPLSQFPPVSPPMVVVTCNYPGASASDVAQAVAAPIEEQVNGVEGMMFMASYCTNDGTYILNVTFQHGIDLNMAQVLVQNRVSLAIPLLPDVIKQTGVSCKKQAPDILFGLALHSTNGRYDQLYLSNYAVMQIRDEVTRLDGVSDVKVFGERDYSMRVWVNPEQLASRNMTAGDVADAIREQNLQTASGSIGQQPANKGQEHQVTLSALGRLKTADQFGEIIIKAMPDGRLTRLKDVARVELGAQNQDVSVAMDGNPTVFLAVFQMPDANGLETHDRVLAKMDELKKSFPEGLDYDIAFDTTPYTRESINEVFKTLRDAILLVALVVLVFLQNWRSTIIPLVAVPVAIVGTFAAMAIFGFSLNNLTLFGLVLAIGIVVDDAIVVVEAVEHHIDLGLSPRDATIRAMQQVSGPVIAVGLVLSAVFVPCAFITGITGQFFRQFALTISVSTLISAFNSLTLSPALTAVLLRPRDKTAAPPLPRLACPLLVGWAGWSFLGPYLAAHAPQVLQALPNGLSARLIPLAPWLGPIVGASCGVALGWFLGGGLNQLLGWCFRAFNRGLHHATHGYTRIIGGLLRVSLIVLVLYGGLLGVTWWRFKVTPAGFIPSQDMGYLMINVQLPDAASTQRTQEVIDHMMAIARKVPGIRHVSGVVGQSLVANAYGSTFGTMFVNLQPYDQRRDPRLASPVIADDLRARFAKNILGANIMVFPPPPVRGVGRAGGFLMMVEDRGDLGPNELQHQTEEVVRQGNQTKGLMGLASVFRANVPQYRVVPDLAQCMHRNVRPKDFTDTLSIYQGSLYVNDFNLFDRTWQVIVQADTAFRDRPEYIRSLKVRNTQGGMVPLGSLASLQEVNGPLVLTRYNMYPSAGVIGYAAPGVSSKQALDLMQKLANRLLPRNMAFEWTDMSYLELLAGNTATLIFGFSVVMVFLVLAAQYESWSLPLAVILVVPMCLLSALIGVSIAHLDVNIFTRIGFVVLVGLASKNAILIVEFAKQQRLAGASRREATLAACQLRLRPIVMTSFAFILGVVPLMLATWAAAEMRRALGTAVFSGMLGVTLFGLVLTPVFFFSIDWLCESRLFSTRLMRALSGRAIVPVSPKFLWRVGSQFWQKFAAMRRTPPRPSPPQVNVEIVVVEPEVVVESDDVPVLPDASTNGGETVPGRRSYRQHPN